MTDAAPTPAASAPPPDDDRWVARVFTLLEAAQAGQAKAWSEGLTALRGELGALRGELAGFRRLLERLAIVAAIVLVVLVVTVAGYAVDLRGAGAQLTTSPTSTAVAAPVP